MAVNNPYPNLPGHLVEFKDGGLQFISSGDEDQVGGKSILILGTAFDGPTNNPVKVSESGVSLVFGSELDENGRISKATITKAAKQAFRNGFTDVRCMRVTGNPAGVEVSKKVPADPATEHETNSSEEISYISHEAGIEANLSNFPICSAKNTPFYADAVVAGQDSEGRDITGSLSYDAHTGVVKINGTGTFKRGATGEFTYSYIDGSTIEKKALSDTASTDASSNVFVELTVSDLATKQIFADEWDQTGEAFDIGSTVRDTSNEMPKNKKSEASLSAVDSSDGIIVKTSGGTVLERFTDYNVTVDSDNQKIRIVFESGAPVANGDTVDVDVYLCEVNPAHEQITLVPSTPEEINITALFPADGDFINPAVDSVKVNGNTVPVESYTFSNVAGVAKVTIAAAFMNTVATGEKFVVNVSYDKNLWEEYKFWFKTKNSGKVYNTAKLEIQATVNEAGEQGRKYILTKPEGKEASSVDKVLEYTSFDFPTIELLALGLDNDLLNNGMFELVYEDGNVETGNVDPQIYMFGNDPVGHPDLVGDDGVNVTEKQLYDALCGVRNSAGYLTRQGAYQVIENYSVDYLYPAGAYADSKLDFHYQLALTAAALTYRTKMTHGLIDMKPCSNRSLIGVQKYVQNAIAWSKTHNPMYMLDLNGEPFTDTQGNKREIGWYTSVVIGPEVIMTSDKLGTYYGSPAIAYGALNANIPPQSAPTLKKLSGVNGLKFAYSNKQQNDLIGARFVVFKTKNEGTSVTTSQPYVVDGCTYGQESCDYARMSTVKVVTDVVDQIREVCEPFLGEPNTIEQRNAMSALISKRLSYLMEGGEILHFEFEVLSTLQQMLLGECQISLTLVPPMELRKITTVVALRAAA